MFVEVQTRVCRAYFRFAGWLRSARKCGGSVRAGGGCVKRGTSQEADIGQDVFDEVDAVELEALRCLIQTVLQTAFRVRSILCGLKIGNLIIGEADNQVERVCVFADGLVECADVGNAVPYEIVHINAV